MDRKELIHVVAPAILQFENRPFNHKQLAAVAGITKAGDKESFKQAILHLYENRELCVEMGRNGREFILKNLTRAVGTQKYVDVIKSFER